MGALGAAYSFGHGLDCIQREVCVKRDGEAVYSMLPAQHVQNTVYFNTCNTNHRVEHETLSHITVFKKTPTCRCCLTSQSTIIHDVPIAVMPLN
jgi:hypothetical protein